MNLEIIDDPQASLAELKAADQELTARLARFHGQREATIAESDQVAKSATPQEGAAAIVSELQQFDLLIASAQKLKTGVRSRIGSIEAQARARAAAEENARQAAERLELRRQRNAAIDRAEAHFLEAAKEIREVFRISELALQSAASKPSFHAGQEIVQGISLVPALTKRCWLQAGFSHPTIPQFDNLFAHQAAPLRKVFAFECDRLDLPQE